MLQFPLEQELALKYQTLPGALREALESRYNLKHMREVTKKYSLIEEDAELVVQFTGLSLLGFLNPRDLAPELFNYLELRDKKTIDAFTGELIQKIFAPLKYELQNLYRTPNIFPEPTKKSAPRPEAPTLESRETLLSSTPPPAAKAKLAEQPVPIRKEEARPRAEVPSPAPTVQSGPVDGPARGELVEPVPLETLRMAPEPVAPALPSSPVASGASRGGPERERDEPLRPLVPAPAKIHPFALSEMSFAPTAPFSAAYSAKAASPVLRSSSATEDGAAKAGKASEGEHAPFMLHKEEALSPILKSKTIQIERASSAMPPTGKLAAARIEMSGMEEEKKKEPVVARTEVPRERVVHYGTFRTPLNPFGGEMPAPTTPPSAPAPLLKATPAAPTPPQKTEVQKSTAQPQAAAPPRPVPTPQAKEDVIDLSTFQRTPKPSVSNPTPSVEGNTVDLRG